MCLYIDANRSSSLPLGLLAELRAAPWLLTKRSGRCSLSSHQCGVGVAWARTPPAAVEAQERAARSAVRSPRTPWSTLSPTSSY